MFPGADSHPTYTIVGTDVASTFLRITWRRAFRYQGNERITVADRIRATLKRQTQQAVPLRPARPFRPDGLSCLRSLIARYNVVGYNVVGYNVV